MGQDVRTIQQQLNRIRRNFPALPAAPVSNIFDAATEEAVRAFQGIFNLPADGIVGKATWYKIKEV
ncbi:peptidoglycan-binding domain-containing protein, partial [Klebsiella pneumoniae]|uniref:peptidoglycan-binding domain-containing protein n=1 Tax=Klebsiella pneumoniae TaxID=573 RepID=UPI0025A0A1EC